MNYAVDVVMRKADNLATLWLEQLDGRPAAGDAFDLLVETALGRLSLPPASAKAVADSLCHPQNRGLDLPTLRREAWRLAGNVHRLKDTAPVPPWTSQRWDEWCPVQVREAKPAVLYNGRRGWEFVVTVLAGSPAGERIRFAWNRSRCRYVAGVLGFSRFPGENRTVFEAGEQFVLLRFLVEITPETCRNGRPAFDEIKPAPALLKHNKDVLRLRRRATVETQCPYGFPLTTACHRCEVGYDRCDAGARPVTLETILPKINPS